MKLFTLLSRQSPNKVFLAIVLSAVSGLGYSAMIPILLASIADQEVVKQKPALFQSFISIEILSLRFAMVFAVLCVIVLVTRACAQLLLTRVALDATSRLRLDIYHAISRSFISEVERMGTTKPFAALSTDVSRVVNGAAIAPGVFASLISVFGMLTYVFFLDADVFYFICVAILFGVVTYQIPASFGRRFYLRSRRSLDSLYDGVRGLIHGAKELKLNAGKRAHYFEEVLLANESEVVRHTLTAERVITLAANYGGLLSFLVMGFITYIFASSHPLTSAQLSGVIMGLLYITGPITFLLGAVPGMMMASVSLRQIERTFAELKSEPRPEVSLSTPFQWSSVTLSGIEYVHVSGEEKFALGPIDLRLNRGQITFIVGGNGSGKSTLGKLVALHYAPARGSIAFDDVLVGPENIERCRQSISAIFSDYFLFERLLQPADAKVTAEVSQYLKEFKLDHKVRMEGGRFSTTALSDGQRRRLALLAALLEDRDLLLFDEWAADQDPEFRKVFYREILPGLRKRNKAIAVISHDDRYFDVADQIITLAEGKAISVRHLTEHRVSTDDRAASVAIHQA